MATIQETVTAREILRVLRAFGNMSLTSLSIRMGVSNGRPASEVNAALQYAQTRKWLETEKNFVRLTESGFSEA